MQSVSGQFTTDTAGKNRRIIGKVEIDWDKDGVFTDESAYLKVLEIDQRVKEPLGGIILGQMDMVLNNTTDRFSPGSVSPIEEDLVRGRPSKCSVGFDSTFLQIGRGISEVPKIERKKREVKLHFFDELNTLDEYVLSGGGELFEDIRTDRYIWGILDEVYGDFFDVIASCDTDESWTGGASESVNQRGGDACRKVQSTSGAEKTDYTEPGSPLDLSGYAGTDYVDLFVFCEDSSLIENVELRLETTAGVNLFYKVLNGDLVTGWNEIRILKSDFSGASYYAWRITI